MEPAVVIDSAKAMPLSELSSYRMANSAFQAWKRELAEGEKRAHTETKAK